VPPIFRFSSARWIAVLQLPRWRESPLQIPSRGCSSTSLSPSAGGWPDDLYCMFFRDGKQLPWFKVGASRKRRCKERDKLAAKVDALAEVCDASSRAQLVEILADTTGVTFSSELLRALCEIVGIRNAFTSFEYLHRGEREGLEPPGEPMLVPTEADSRG
jgi:hypothetical protein